MARTITSTRFFVLATLVAVVAVVGIGTLAVKADSGSSSTATASNAKATASPDEAKKDEKPPVPVRVATVTSGSVSSYITATANLVPENDVKVLAEAEGRVTRLEVEEGDQVRKGQLLATLDRADAEILLQKATLRADNARTAYQRATRLAEENLVTQQDFDTTLTDHKLAEQELAEARWRLEKTEIRAPFDGRLTQRMITVGQHVTPGVELFRVTDFDPLVARVYLPEKDVLPLRQGRQVRITLEADAAVHFAGRIRQIAPVVDTGTGTVKVTVEAGATPDTVRPGCFVTIDIVRETRSDVLLLPREAVLQELQAAHVFVVVDGKAVKREVTLGLEDGDNRQVLDGVTAGDRVVVAGQGSLKDGATVSVIDAASASPSRDVMARL